MHVVFLSEIQPGDTGASPSVLKAHLERLGSNYKQTRIDETNTSYTLTLTDRIFRKIFKLFSKDQYLQYTDGTEAKKIIRHLSSHLKDKNVDVVLCLALGRLGLHGWLLAEQLGVPVVSLYHDWWPEMVKLYHEDEPGYHAMVARQFDQLHSKSFRSLSVCRGMADLLPTDGDAQVLYPTPTLKLSEEDLAQRPSPDSIEPLRITYAGSLWAPYGDLLSKLTKELENASELKFQLSGDPKYLDAETLERWNAQKIFNPPVSFEEHVEVITKGTDLLLVVMGRDPEESIRMKTSFPSKICNFVNTGNPVMIWAPRGTSLGDFAADLGHPGWIETEDPALAASELLAIAQDDARVEAVRKSSQRIAREVLNSDRLQEIFEASLTDAVASR